MSGFHSFGHSFGASGGASGGAVSLEELRSILPIHPGETVQVGDTAEIRKGEIYKSLQKIGTTKAVADIGLGTVDTILNIPALIPLDEKRALCFISRYYAVAPVKYTLEAFILQDNGDSFSLDGAVQTIIDYGNTSSGWAENMDLMQLDEGKYLLTYRNTLTQKMQGTVVLLNGNVVTHANTFDISPGTMNGAGYHASCRLATNKVLVSYVDVVRVITFEGTVATLHPEFDHMTTITNQAYARKLVAISETNVIIFYKITTTGNPLHAKLIKVNNDNTCSTNPLTTGTGFVMDSYEFEGFFGNNAVFFDGNKVAFLAKSRATDLSSGNYLFITEISEDGMKIVLKMRASIGSNGSSNGGLFHVGKDTDGNYYFVVHTYVNSNSYLSLYRVLKDLSSLVSEYAYTGVSFEQDTSRLVSCCFNNNRIMAVSLAGTSKKLVASLHDSRIAMPTGIITQAVQGGANAEIQQLGVVRILSGLIPGAEYYGDQDGRLATIPMHNKNRTDELNKLGVALSENELFIAEAIRR